MYGFTFVPESNNAFFPLVTDGINSQVPVILKITDNGIKEQVGSIDDFWSR